jgi:hypothetical protein
MKYRENKKMKRLIWIFGLLIAMTLVPFTSFALNVYIENPGFEADVLGENYAHYPITGWSTSPGAGTWNPADGYFNGSIPEGNNVTFSNAPAISQLLDYYLLPNTMLTLSVDVGWRLDKLEPGYEIQLLAGGNLLVSGFESLIQGEFVTTVLNYGVTSSNPFLGEQVELLLVNKKYGESTQIAFDNISLQNEMLPIPEPSTLLLLGSGLLGFGYFATKRKKRK